MNGETQSSDKFYYGYRRTVTQDVTGQPSYVDQPLTSADFLNPQPNDHFVLGAEHDGTVGALFQILQYHHRNNLLISVLQSVKLTLGAPDLPDPVADIVVISNLIEPQRRRTVLDVAKEGIKPSCVIEVTAPRFAHADLVEKAAIYEKAAIPEYIVIDSGVRAQDEQQSQTTGYVVVGFELVNGMYEPKTPDQFGRLYSSVNRVWFAPNAEGNGVVVIDSHSGQPIQPQAVIDHDRAAAAQGERRGHELESALDFLRAQSKE